MKKILLFTCFILMSCGAARFSAERKVINESYPEVNQTSTADVGVTLVYKESGYKYKALKINEDRKVKPWYLTKEIQNGEIFINKHDTKKYELYQSPSDPNFGIAIPKSGGKQMFFIYDGDGTKIVELNNPISYSSITAPIKEDDYYRQEFIYNGKLGTGIKFSYREFAGNTARPAFTQDLQYDLAESKIIGFKGLRIEIIDATNTNIKYRVLNQF